MMIPFANLQPLVSEVTAGITHDFQQILTSREFIGGATVTRLEAELARQLHVKHVVACGSGSAALTLALSACDIGPHDTIAIPDVTFWATYEAAAHAGRRVVLVDIDPDDLQMNFKHFKDAFDRHRFKAAILPHLFGWASARLTDFRKFCRERQIVLIEDAAQAFGVAIGDGRHPVLAHDASIATLSFFPGKVIGGISDGGAVATNSTRVADVVRLLANHGRTSHYEHALVGWNSRMSTVNAAYLLRVLALSEKILAQRRRAFWLYRDLIGASSLIPPPSVAENGYLNVTLGEARGETARKLRERGVSARQTYPLPIHLQQGARAALPFGDLQHSSDFCSRVVNLPLWYGISDKQVETCATAFLEVTR